MPDLSKLPRLKLPLGKFRVSYVTRNALGLGLALDLPGLGKLIVSVPIQADVREGDLLTLYTEVLSSANPNPTH
jgi:hypothetical protein